jgi:hypothetical protein
LPDSVSTVFFASGEAGTASKKSSVSCTAGGFSPPMFWENCDYDEAVTFTAPAGKSGFSFQWHTSMVGGQPSPNNARAGARDSD